jgi:hypothetical protein
MKKKVRRSVTDQFIDFCFGNMQDYIILHKAKYYITLYNPKTEECIKASGNGMGPSLTKYKYDLKNLKLFPYRRNSSKLLMEKMDKIQLLVLKYKLKKLGIKKVKISERTFKVKQYYLFGPTNVCANILDIPDKGDAAMFRMYFNQNVYNENFLDRYRKK